MNVHVVQFHFFFWLMLLSPASMQSIFHTRSQELNVESDTNFVIVANAVL